MSQDLSGAVTHSDPTPPMGQPGDSGPSRSFVNTAALFLVDEQGVIRQTNGLPAKWWGGEPQAIIGRYFPDLFYFEIDSSSDDDRAVQWRLLASSGMITPVRLSAKSAFCDRVAMSVNFSRANGESGSGYFVSVSREESGSLKIKSSKDTAAPDVAPPPEADPESAAPPPVIADDNWQILGEKSEVGLFDLNFETGDTYYSPSWKSLFGYDAFELEDVPETWQNLVHPEDSDAAPYQSEKREPRAVIPFCIEYRMQRKGGRHVWVESSGIQQFDEFGTLARVVGVTHDIQERKEMEEESLLNEDRFLTIAYKSPFAYFDIDFENQTAFFSPRWRQQLGLSEGDLEPTPEAFLKRILPEETVGGLGSFFREPEQDRSYFTKSYRLRRKDDEYAEFQSQIVRILNRRSELIRVIGFQVEADQAEAIGSGGPMDSGPLYRALQCTNEGVLVANAYGNILFMNRKAEKIIGCEPEAWKERLVTEFFRCIHRNSGTAADGLIDRVISSRESLPINDNYNLLTFDDQEKQIVLACDLLKDAKDRQFGVVVVFRDPNELPRTPEELIACNRMEALGILASGVAHDFNNLVTAIMGSLSVAKDAHEWDKLQEADNGCNAARELTRQILVFARGASTQRKAIVVSDMVKDCARLAAAGAKVPIDVRLANDLNPALIDTPQIIQAIQNLLINAIQAIPGNGKVTVSANNVSVKDGEVDGLDAGDYVLVSVHDTGSGIPPEIMPEIFDAFFTTKENSTGLGLTMAKSILEKHQGQLLLTSDPENGTTATMYLPKADRPAEEPSSQAPAIKFGKGRVLVMDDDEDICSVAAGMLDLLEYEYDIARTGEEAIALYRKYFNVGRPYDVVILDLTVVGGMGGDETLARLKIINPEVRALVSSGYTTDDAVDKFIKRGYCGMLAKPYRSADLGRALKAVLQ